MIQAFYVQTRNSQRKVTRKQETNLLLPYSNLQYLPTNFLMTKFWKFSEKRVQYFVGCKKTSLADPLSENNLTTDNGGGATITQEDNLTDNGILIKKKRSPLRASQNSIVQLLKRRKEKLRRRRFKERLRDKKRKEKFLKRMAAKREQPRVSSRRYLPMNQNVDANNKQQSINWVIVNDLARGKKEKPRKRWSSVYARRLIDYKNVSLLRYFVTAGGKILSKHDNNLFAKEQRHVGQSIKSARQASLLPFIINNHILKLFKKKQKKDRVFRGPKTRRTYKKVEFKKFAPVPPPKVIPPFYGKW